LARRGADQRVQAQGQGKKIAMIGALDWSKRQLHVVTLRSKRSADFIALLNAIDQGYGPKPGAEATPVVLTLDNGPIHKSRATQEALASRAHWLAVEWLHNTPRNSTISSGATSRRIISPIRPSPTRTTSKRPSIAPLAP